MSDCPDHAPVPPAKRETVLERDGYRCQYCGEKGTAIGGFATLEIHHKDREPEDMAVHDLENLITACRACHNWHHQQTTDEEVPVDLSEADLSELLPHDLNIIKVLAEIGPASTGEIAEAMTTDNSLMTVRLRLYVLMGLDNVVDSRETQLIDQDADSGKWGLPGQIARSERGRIPKEPQTLLQRAEDEQVRQALERGCSREAIGDVIGVTARTTWDKEKRANAYDFPLEAVSRAGGGSGESSYPSTGAAAGQDGDQQQSDTVAAVGDGDQPTAEATAVPDGETAGEGAEAPRDESVAIQAELTTAIEALQAAKESIAGD